MSNNSDSIFSNDDDPNMYLTKRSIKDIEKFYTRVKFNPSQIISDHVKSLDYCCGKMSLFKFDIERDNRIKLFRRASRKLEKQLDIGNLLKKVNMS